jgi:hypothetical protein
MIPQWRVDWVARENARRDQAFPAALQVWARQGDELRVMRSVAASFHGQPDPAYPDELVYLTVPGSQVVEAPQVGALPPVTPTLPPLLAAGGPSRSGVSVGAEGVALVTSRRLRFLGPGFAREWPYEALTGLGDDDRAPMTLLQVAGAAASGLLVPVNDANRFRLHLRLAIADAAGGRAGMVAQLDQFIGWHQTQRPRPLDKAEPHQAPATAWWTKGRLTVAAVLAGLVLCCCGGKILNNATSRSARPLQDLSGLAPPGRIGSEWDGITAPAGYAVLTTASGSRRTTREVQQSDDSVAISLPQLHARLGPSQPSRPQQPFRRLRSG